MTPSAVQRRSPAGGPGWVDHLRAGGTSGWSDWLERHGPAGELPRGALPGAQELELLRRLNLVARPSRALTERVLAAGGTGRGRLDLELAGDGPTRAHGPRPVEPTDLPAEEMLRVAVGLVAEDLVARAQQDSSLLAGPRPSRAPGRLARRLPGRRRCRVVGDPRLAAAARDAAARRHRPVGGRNSHVLVLGAGLEQMLADAWCSRFAGPGAPAWPVWLGGLVERGDLPPRIDLAALARHWAEREGRARVHVVLDAGALPRLIRARNLSLPEPPPGAGAAELARRVAAVLGVLVEPRLRHRLVADALPWFGTLDVARGAPGVPAWAAPWLDRRERVLTDAVRSGGYRVHGDPDALLDRTGGGWPGPEQALAVAVAALTAADAERGRDRAEERR